MSALEFIVFLLTVLTLTSGKPSQEFFPGHEFINRVNYNNHAIQTRKIITNDFTAFVSYRRAASKHLAMLIKVMLEDKGYPAFIDVEDLEGGFWDEQLVNKVMETPNFLLVLSNGTLDRALGDSNYTDYLHKEIKLAVETDRRIIPIFDDNFQFPPSELLSPELQTALQFQGVNWIHALTDCSIDRIIEYFSNDEGTTLFPPSTTPGIPLALPA